MPGKRHKKRDNKTDGQAPAIPTVDGPAVDEAAQERGTEHEGSSSGDVPAVNQATSQPKEGRTSTDFLSLPLYSASDSESGDHGSQDRGGDVTSEQRVIASAGSSGGGERAEGAGEVDILPCRLDPLLLTCIRRQDIQWQRQSMLWRL